MTRGAFSSQDGARNVDVKILKHALARADLIKSFQPQYQQRISRARMLLDLRECIQVLHTDFHSLYEMELFDEVVSFFCYQIGAWADAQAILESAMQVFSFSAVMLLVEFWSFL